MSVWPWQCGQTKQLMFSTSPRIGTETFRNMETPLPASMRATSWGVVTMIAPVSRIFCEMEIWTSPVPGGRSKTSASVPSQSTSLINCSIALPAIGPRQTIGVWRSTR